MKSYEFKLVLADVSDLTDDQGDALFEAGCDDGTIVSRDGEVCVCAFPEKLPHWSKPSIQPPPMLIAPDFRSITSKFIDRFKG